MRAAVLIPWRSTECPHRLRALEYVTARYAHEHPQWPVVLGHCDAGPWIKAAAVDAALRQTSAEILIVADADVWTDGLAAAVEHVSTWAIPHRGVHRLTAAATSRYIAGEPWRDLSLDERAYLGVEGGGITVIRRELYTVCPLDPRFVGWGSEDDSWGVALRALYGSPWRGKAGLVHLWHPAQQRATRSWGSLEGRDLRKRYVRARGDEDAMRALVAEYA